MDLPAPGGPTSRMLCPPAAATSSARLTFSCALTSEKSTENCGAAENAGGGMGAMGFSPRRWCTSCEMFSTGYTVTPSAKAASAALPAGTKSSLRPICSAASAIVSAPVTGRISPARLTSPKKAAVAGGWRISPVAHRMPSSTGRS